MPALSLQKVCAAPWGAPLLQDIELQVSAGEVIAVIGPNGAGKSSLLHAIAGGLPVASGDLSLCNRPLHDWPARERARALALQAQHGALNFPFTVEEVIQMARIPHGSGASCDAVIVDEVLAATDTANLRHRLFTQLSGGERQRVQLARAVAQIWRARDSRCRVLLLDEPSSALDLAHQRMVLALVTRLADQGVAVIMSTHDYNLIAASADQVLVLNNGCPYHCGHPTEVLTTEMFTRVFKVDVLVQQHPETGAPLVVQR